MRGLGLLGLLFVFNVSLVQADDLGSALDFTIQQSYVSTRALAMGNAFGPVVDDYSAIFYNPAALAKRKDGDLHLPLRAGMSDGLQDFLTDVDDATSIGDEDEEVDAINELIQKNFGEQLHLRASLPSGFLVRPNWGLAVLPGEVSADIAFHRGVGPTVNVNVYADTQVAFAYAGEGKLGSRDNKFYWGSTVFALHRVFASQALNATTLADDAEVFDESIAAEGLTVDAHVGFLFEPAIPNKRFFKFLEYAKPTFSFVVRNIADYGFPINLGVVNDEEKEPPKLQRRIDTGAKFDLPKLWVFEPKFAFEVRDILHENWSFVKGTHVGAELYWQMFDWWMGYWSVGLNQGYYTAGIGAKFSLFQIDVATWGEEAGSDDDPIESRRYMVELSLDF